MAVIDKELCARYFGTSDDPITIREQCKTKFKSADGGKFIGKGAFGTVSEACLNNDCKYVVKMIKLSEPGIKKMFEMEALILPVFGQLGISPKVHDIFICLNAGFIIMDKWDGDLMTLFKHDIKLEKKRL